MRNYIRVFLLSSIVSLSGHAAADALDRIRERGQLLVAVKNDGNPERAAHKDPAHFDKRNFEVALAHAIASELLGDPAKVAFVLLRKPERVPAVQTGRADLAISMLRPSSRNVARVDFSEPYYQAGAAVMQLPPGRVSAAADLKGLRLGAIARNDVDKHALLLNAGQSRGPAALVEFPDFDAAADALRAGDIDALFSEVANIKAYVTGHREFVSSPPLSSEPVCVAVPKDEAALRASVDTVIRRLRESGDLDKMRAAQGLD